MLCWLGGVPLWNGTELAFSADTIGRNNLFGDPACEKIALATESDEMMLQYAATPHR